MYWYNAFNPFLIFSAIWGIVLGLLSLHITTNIGNLKVEMVVLIVINIITSSMIFFLYFINSDKKFYYNEQSYLKQNAFAVKFSSKLLFLWITLCILDIVYSGGFPLLWKFTNSSIDYTNMGIPSLRGVQHTLYLFLFTIYVLAYKFFKTKKIKILLIIFILYPIVMLSRSLMMYALFQILCASLFFNKLKFRILFKGLIFFLLIILIFGIIGDNRGENPNPFSYLIDSEYFELMSSLPSGFTWVYVYLTANFNNINTTYGNYELSYSLLDIFYNVVPGALKSYFIEPKDSVLITDANLNVASFYAGYITSFGIIGAIVGGIILQLFSIKYYFLALRGNLGHLVVYSILFSCICISVFFDAFMTISTLGQIFLSLFLSHKIKYLQIDQ